MAVTVRAPDGTVVGRVTVVPGGAAVAEVLHERGRPLVEAVAATAGAPRPPRARAACAGGDAPRGGHIGV
jgi:hypothetical protein